MTGWRVGWAECNESHQIRLTLIHGGTRCARPTLQLQFMMAPGRKYAIWSRAKYSSRERQTLRDDNSRLSAMRKLDFLVGLGMR